MAATQLLERTLKKANNLPRQSVLVCIFQRQEDDSLRLQAKDHTNWQGYIQFDITDWPTGVYEIQYYGDGIIETRFDAQGQKIEEDPVTPWEYGIVITNQGIEYDKTPPEGSESGVELVE